jgi:hypothetical protein
MHQVYKVHFVDCFVLTLMFPIPCKLLPDTLVMTNVPLPDEMYGLSGVKYLKDCFTHSTSLLSFMPLPHAPFSFKRYLASEIYDL